MEKRDELWPRGPCFYYDTALFPPGTDSFCLAYFARPSRGDTVCDLGSGIGLLGTLLLARQESLFIENVEISAPAAALARKTFAENGWADRAAFHEGDLRDVSVLPKAGSVDYVISNPPYFPAGSGESAKGEARQIAREETACTLDDVCAAAQRVLRYGGRFTLVHRAERLADVLCAMRSHGIEPKRLRFLAKSPDAAPSLLFVEGKRDVRRIERDGGRLALFIADIEVLIDDLSLIHLVDPDERIAQGICLIGDRYFDLKITGSDGLTSCLML